MHCKTGVLIKIKQRWQTFPKQLTSEIKMLLLLQLQAWIRKKEQTFVTKQNGTITKTGIVHSTRFYEQIRTKTENAKLWTHEDVGCRRVAKSFMAIPGRHHTERVAKSFTATPGRHQTGKVAKSIVEFLGRHQTERVAKGFTVSRKAPDGENHAQN